MSTGSGYLRNNVYWLHTAIFDLPLLLIAQISFCSNSVMLPDPENIVIAVRIVLLSCLQAMMRYFISPCGYWGHLRFVHTSCRWTVFLKSHCVAGLLVSAVISRIRIICSCSYRHFILSDNGRNYLAEIKRIHSNKNSSSKTIDGLTDVESIAKMFDS